MDLVLFIFLSILFLVLLFFSLDLGKECDVISYMMITKHDGGMTHVTDTDIQSCDTEKDIEGSGTNDVI